jgi:serine phosphatase RsbU (regulator of sigma subunit)
MHLSEGAAGTASSAFTVSSAVRNCEGGERCRDAIAYRYLADGSLTIVVVGVAGHGAVYPALADWIALNLLGLLVMQCRIERAMGIAERDFTCEIARDVGQSVAVFAALLDANERRLSYVSAAHETALVLSRDRSHRHLGITGPAFGITTKHRHQPASARFAPGDQLVVVTDGVTDARSKDAIAFGSRGVLRVASGYATGEDPARSLLDEASRYATSPLGDRAALVVSYPRHY